MLRNEAIDILRKKRELFGSQCASAVWNEVPEIARYYAKLHHAVLHGIAVLQNRNSKMWRKYFARLG